MLSEKYILIVFPDEFLLNTMLLKLFIKFKGEMEKISTFRLF